MIHTQGLTRTFRAKDRIVDAVRGIDLDVAEGELVAFLGPNGAGKSTTLRMLTTLLRPTSGTAVVAGHDVMADPDAVRTRIGSVGQGNGAGHSHLAIDELVNQGRCYGLSKADARARAAELLESMGLADLARRMVSTLSGGQRRRLDIAMGMVHRPSLLFLDEPSTGLDPASRLFVWDRVQALKAAGTTVMLTTHDMHEAAVLCDRLGIMDHGQLLTLGEPSALTNDLPGERTLDVTVTLGEATTIDECTRQLLGLTEVLRVEHVTAPTTTQDNVRLRLAATGEAAALVGPVATTLASLGAALTGVTLGDPSLEDVFIHLTGRGLR
jgi:ABC-2 type transport system ATP-binding protein